MNPKEFFSIILKERSIIFATILLVIISVFFIKIIEPSKSVVYLDIEIKKINKPNTIEYQFDQYYSIQAASMVTDIVNSWFKNKNFKTEIMKEIIFNREETQDLENYVSSRKLSNQNLEVKVTTNDPETSLQIAKKISEDIQAKVKNLSFETNNNPAFRADVAASKAQRMPKNFTILFFASLVTGLILGIFFALISYKYKK